MNGLPLFRKTRSEPRSKYAVLLSLSRLLTPDIWHPLLLSVLGAKHGRIFKMCATIYNTSTIVVLESQRKNGRWVSCLCCCLVPWVAQAVICLVRSVICVMDGWTVQACCASTGQDMIHDMIQYMMHLCCFTLHTPQCCTPILSRHLCEQLDLDQGSDDEHTHIRTLG